MPSLEMLRHLQAVASQVLRYFSLAEEDKKRDTKEETHDCRHRHDLLRSRHRLGR